LSSTWGFATPNANRIAGPMMDNNFGLISIDWTKETIKFEAKDVDSKTNFEKEIRISDLDFK
jgi:alkaline phosphatase D